ncbi:MAG: hypothetical protein V3U96_08995 [Paracoccaceae bacterium]
MIKFFGTFCSALVLSTGIAQATTIYECKLNAANNSWISADILIEYDETNGNVIVHDGLGYSINDGKPVQGKVTRDRNEEISFSWSIRSVLNSKRQRTPAFNFRRPSAKLRTGRV